MNLKDITDKELMQRIRENDQKAHSLAYRKYEKAVSNQVYNMIHSAKADEIISDSWIKVFDKIKEGVEIENLGGYLQRTARNNALDHLRKKDRFIFYQIDDGTEYVGNTGKTHFEKMDVRQVEISYYEEGIGNTQELQENENRLSRIILGEVCNLSTAYRNTFVHSVIEGKPHKEIAKEFGVTENTSKSNLFKAKKSLRERIKENYSKDFEDLI